MRGLFTVPRWLIGFLAGVVGWVFYVAALKLAPLSLVQAASAGGIGVLALLVARTTHAPLARRELWGVVTRDDRSVLLGLSLSGHTDAGDPGRVPPSRSGSLVRGRPPGSSPGPGRGCSRAEPVSARPRDHVRSRRRRHEGRGLRRLAVRVRAGAARLSRRRLRRAPVRLPARRRARDRGRGDGADERAADRRRDGALQRGHPERCSGSRAHRRVRRRRRRGRAARAGRSEPEPAAVAAPS